MADDTHDKPLRRETASMRDLAYGLVRVLDDEGTAVGQWDPKLPPGGFIVVHRHFRDDGSVDVIGIEQHSLAGVGGH